MKWNKSFMKMLNKTGPNMEPCGTPLCKSTQELRQLPILTRCLRRLRLSAMSSQAGIEKNICV